MKKFISVNKHRVACNVKHGTRMVVLRVQQGKNGRGIYGHEVVIRGESKLTYNPDGPILKCGARVVLETDAEVDVVTVDDGGRRWTETLT